jgi:hypothetical protein
MKEVTVTVMNRSERMVRSTRTGPLVNCKATTARELQRQLHSNFTCLILRLFISVRIVQLD